MTQINAYSGQALVLTCSMLNIEKNDRFITKTVKLPTAAITKISIAALATAETTFCAGLSIVSFIGSSIYLIDSKS